MAHRIRGGVVAAVALAIPAAACTDSDDPVPATTVVATTTTEPVRESDGVLTIGVLLPTTDALLGQGLVQATLDAITRINDAGGVLGREIVAVIEDEGSTSATANAAIEALLEQDVDAIVGPASSTVALTTLSDILDAGVLACSPTASALALDAFPDDDLLFFRTIPSDSLQAVAIAQVVEETGAQDAVIAHADDAFGQPFAAAVEEALRQRGIAVTASIGFRGSDDDLTARAEELASSGVRAAVILANDQDAASLLESLAQTNFRAISALVVNDALRSPASAQRIEALPGALRVRITGVGPQARADDPDNPGTQFGPFAVNAFDCVNLIALAAVQGNSDDPDVIKTQMQSVSSGGRLCRTFESCVNRLAEGLQINYNGPSGITELLQRGDPRRARFELFSFDETGRDQSDSSIVVEIEG